MKKYVLNARSISEWMYDELFPFGSLLTTLEFDKLEFKIKQTIEFWKRDGDNYLVLFHSKTLEEREARARIQMEHELICKVSGHYSVIERINKELLKTRSLEDYKATKEEYENRQTLLTNAWNQLSFNVQEKFKDSINSNLLVEDDSKSHSEQKRNITHRDENNLKFKDFFIPEKCIEPRQIAEIKNYFKNSQNKTLAFLILHLETDLKIIRIIQGSRTQSRQHFLKALTEQDQKKWSSVNEYLGNNHTSKVLDLDSSEYYSIKETIENIIEPKSSEV